MPVPITELYCASTCVDDGKPTQLAGAGIILICTDDLGRAYRRSFSWYLGSSNSRLAEIQAARLALCSILPAFRNQKTKLYTTKRVIKIVTGEVNPMQNQREIAELRKWYGFYEDIEAISVANIKSQDLVEARDLAKKALDGRHSDSGTIMPE